MFGFKNPKDKNTEQNQGIFSRLKQGLNKTRQGITEGLSQLVLGKKQIDADLLEDLENRLLMADLGVESSQAIIDDLSTRLNRKQLDNPQALLDAMKENMLAMLKPCEKPLHIGDQKPYTILMVGINGAGKTTTIGKLAKRLQQQSLTVMLAAGDTFRAAAVEQLQAWGEKNSIPVVAQHSAADPAAVVYDAMQSAHAKQLDVLLADTAGRLHTQSNLMDELAKIKRVAAKFVADAPQEILLVLDATTGQNALQQAKQFNAAMGLTGLILTKMDGTAKGGVIFAIANQLKLPIYFIGIGEGIDDLRPFEAEPFVDALLSVDSE